MIKRNIIPKIFHLRPSPGQPDPSKPKNLKETMVNPYQTKSIQKR
jgi:hypothetical protein